MSERVTDAEFLVMDALWQEAPLAASEVSTRLVRQTGWSAQTVKTLLSRLVDKGAVAAEADGRRYLYRPLLAREDYAQQAAHSLVSRLFGGKAAPLVAHLADAGELTAEDIKDIEALLEDIKNGRR
ncbi:MAG: BlaI/MecI/CopY family transcriptional regulator [Parvularculaceae bacterium]|nr:BlaI/MecI/CopY family transcriptional regulator [Parvularculaceae bacterium]